MSEILKKKWQTCAFLTMFFSGLCVTTSNIVVPMLREHWGLSYSNSGTMLAMLVVGSTVTGILAGILPGYIGERGSNLLLAVGIALGYGLLMLSGNVSVIYLSFALIGGAKGATINNGTLLLNRTSDNPVKSINLMHACYAIGGLICPFVVGVVSKSWWHPLLVMCVLGVLDFLVFVWAGLSTRRPDRAERRSQWGFLKSRFFWLLVVALFFQCCSEQAVTGWVVSYFKDSGILSARFSDYTVTVVWGAMLLARLFIAFVLKIKDNFKALSVMTAAALVSYLLLLRSHTGGAALGTLFLFGLSVAGTNPTLMASIGKLLSPAALAVLLPVGGLGGIVMPYIVGAVAEVGGINAGMTCPLVSMVLLLITLLLCRREQAAQ